MQELRFKPRQSCPTAHGAQGDAHRSQASVLGLKRDQGTLSRECGQRGLPTPPRKEMWIFSKRHLGPQVHLRRGSEAAQLQGDGSCGGWDPQSRLILQSPGQGEAGGEDRWPEPTFTWTMKSTSSVHCSRKAWLKGELGGSRSGELTALPPHPRPSQTCGQGLCPPHTGGLASQALTFPLTANFFDWHSSID